MLLQKIRNDNQIIMNKTKAKKDNVLRKLTA